MPASELSPGVSDENASAATEPDPASLTYEQARDELVAVVQRLESGGVPLEQSLTLWERGEALADRCQQWLDGARERLDAARGPVGVDDPEA